MFENLKEGLIICEASIKKAILEYDDKNNSFLKRHFLTLKELKEKLFFSYHKKAIYYVSKKFNIKPNIAFTYLENIVDLSDIAYDKKLDILYEIKNYLKENNLIINNDLFIDFLKQREIIFIDTIVNIELTKIIERIKQYTTISFFDCFNKNLTKTVYSFDNINEEVNYIFNEISNLKDKGISLNNVKICNASSDYIFVLNRVAKSYGYQLFGLENKGIKGTIFFEKLLKEITLSNSFEELIVKLKRSDNYLINEIIDIINKYEVFSVKPVDFIDVLIFELEKTSFENTLYTEMIEVTPFENSCFDDDNYIFLIGFNNKIPLIKKDVDYLDDKLKDKLNLNTTLIENKIIKEKIIKRINHYSKLIISYCKNTTFNEYLPSNLTSDLKLNIIKINNDIYHNEIEDSISLGLLLDNYYKFGENSDLLNKEYYLEFRYLQFDNQYKKIESEIFNQYKAQTIKLSYTALKQYYSCNFAYFIERILRINKYEDSLEAKLGTFAHEILKDSYNEDFDFIDSKNKHMSLCENKKEEFYFELIAQIVLEVIKYNHENEEYSMLETTLCEKQIDLSYDDGKLIFTGIVDKIKYSKINEEDIVAIIDYKTGSDKASLKNIEDGINLQLPIYLYLIKKSNMFNNPIISGFYLQKINRDIFKKNQKATSLEQLYSSFRLEGYSLSDHKYLAFLNSNYKLNNYIQTLKINKDGSFSKTSKTLSLEDENKITDLVEKLILNAYEDIKKANFKINPKKIDKKDYSCQFCSFKDICFVEYKDYVNLEEKDFLGGEEDVD